MKNKKHVSIKKNGKNDLVDPHVGLGEVSDEKAKKLKGTASADDLNDSTQSSF